MDMAQSTFQILPMLIVHKVIEYLEGRSRNYFGADISEHNKKKAVLAPLLLASERWRSAALESICDNCALSFDYTRRAVEMDLPAWPADYSYPGFRKARLVKRVIVTANLWRDMCDGTFTTAIARPQYEGVAFPSATTLVLVLKQGPNTEHRNGIRTATERDKVASFARSLLQLVPGAAKVVVNFVSTNLSESNHMEMYGTLVSELYQGRVGSIRVNSEISHATISVNLGVTSGLTSIAHGLNVACAQFALLAYHNSKTLKSLHIIVASETDWLCAIHGNTATPVVYSSLAVLALTISDTSYQTTWTPTTEELAPFPSLVTLIVGGGFPFTDDLLFRGNGATLKNLRIPFSALVRDGLGRFSILKRSGITLMNRVRIGACTSTDKEYIAGREDLPIGQQVHRILQTATVMAIDSDTPGVLIFNTICEAPNTAIMQHLELGRLLCAADDIIKLLVALPSLVSLCCGICRLEPEIEAIPASERPSHLCAKYHPLSNNFRGLQVRSDSGLSGELVAYTAMLIAVLCPNFVQVDLPLELRKAFGREIAWALVNDTFKPYADSISRLIYKESGY